MSKKRMEYKVAEPELKPPNKGKGSGRSGYTKLSSACKTNRHSSCAASKCECTCGHPT